MHEPTDRHRRTSEAGATAVEYAILLAAIAAMLIISAALLGTETAGLIGGPCEELTAVGKPCT